jgi:hypothetical protein
MLCSGRCHGHDDKALLDLDETGICPRICAILKLRKEEEEEEEGIACAR